MPQPTPTPTGPNGLASLALLALLLGSNPAQAGPEAGFVSPGIDPNTFIVGHPASPRWTVQRANGEHPGVLISRRQPVAAIDSNTFVVQPPASARWTVQAPALLAARSLPSERQGTAEPPQSR